MRGIMQAQSDLSPGVPDMKVSVRQVFGFDGDFEVPAYSAADSHVPDVDPDYLFDRETTLAILAGFAVLDGALGRGLKTSFVPEEDYGFFFLNVQLPPAASMQRTAAVWN